MAWVNSRRQQLPARAAEKSIATTVRSRRPGPKRLFCSAQSSRWTSTAAHSADRGALCHGAPIGRDMDGFHLSHLHRGRTWLARAVAYGKEKCRLHKRTSFFVMFVRSVNDGQRRDVAHASLTQMVRRSVVLLNRWWHRVEDRNQLSIMSERELRDIGLSHHEADWEIRKPFWRE